MEEEDAAMHMHAIRPDLMLADSMSDDGESDNKDPDSGSDLDDLDGADKENLRIMTPPGSSELNDYEYAGGNGRSDNCGRVSNGGKARKTITVSVHRL